MRDYHQKNKRSTRRGVRDYSRKSYGNPLFKGQKKGVGGPQRNFRRLKMTALVIFALIVAGFLFGTMFFGSSFRISNLVIEGASADTAAEIRSILESQIDSRRLFVLPQSSLFAFDTEAGREKIEDQFFLQELEIRKKLPGTVWVRIVEREMVGAFLAKGQFWAFDQEGFVVRELTKRERIFLADLPEGFEAVAAGELGAESVEVGEIEPVEDNFDSERKNSNPVPLILDWEKVGGDYAPGEEAVSPEMLKLVLQADGQLPNVTDSGVRWFALDSAADTVDVKLKGGWHVYLTTLMPFDVQASRLSLVLREKIGERKEDLEYVDLRYDERIFFRFENSDTEL